MTTYREQTLTPRMATANEDDAIKLYLQNKDKIKELIEANNAILNDLIKCEPIVTKILDKDKDQLVHKTFIVDKPEGHYVVYKEYDLTMNAKTTKKDLKELGLD